MSCELFRCQLSVLQNVDSDLEAGARVCKVELEVSGIQKTDDSKLVMMVVGLLLPFAGQARRRLGLHLTLLGFLNV